MPQKADRELAAELKARVALAALRGHESLEQLASQFGLDPDQIAEWKQQLERNADAVFTRSGAAPGEAPPLEDPPTVPQWPSSPKARTSPEPASGRLPDDDDFWDEQTQPAAGVRTGKVESAAARPPHDEPAPAWSRKLLVPLFVGWQEKHFAAKASREMLKTYRAVAAAHPGLRKPELYREVLMIRLGVAGKAADEVLERASESFATWPVQRSLTFRDVVHYVAISDYLASNQDVADWARENLARVVAAHIPENL